MFAGGDHEGTLVCNLPSTLWPKYKYGSNPRTHVCGLLAMSVPVPRDDIREYHSTLFEAHSSKHTRQSALVKAQHGFISSSLTLCDPQSTL